MAIKESLKLAALYTIIYLLDPIRIVWDMAADKIIEIEEKETP